MSRVAVENALKVVRQKFITTAASQFPHDSMEYDAVLYRTKMLFNKTVMGGKYARSSLCVKAYGALKPFSTEEELKKVAQVACTMEMVQSSYLILDDIMDQSQTRRGEPCWYKRKNIGYGAINDGILIECFVDDLIEQIIPNHPNLNRILKAFRKSKRNTILGQLIDSDSQGKMASFTWERYEQLVQFKTSHYTYFLPIETALLLADENSGHNDARGLAYLIGFLFQSQDDVMDVFGDPSVTGKVGTDLKDGKCTWLTVRAVQKLQDHKDMLAEWTELFGKTDDQSLSRMKRILEELQLHREFRVFEDKYSAHVKEKINTADSSLRPIAQVLLDSVDSIIKRSK
ncbi:unnamed protein product [Auanema sp. JU1783]|nr:unnamed protein product [Auanema sp. JU1783]